MKKYPFSSKAVKIMIATALIATPLAAVPVFADQNNQGEVVVATEGDSTPADTTPVHSTPADTTPVGSTPVDSTPADSTPEGSTPEGSTPEASTPEASTPADSTPAVVNTTFKDNVAGHWANDAINRLTALEIIKGLDGNRFGYRELATRAQMAVFITRSLGLEATTDYKNEFTDVKGTEWFADEFAAAVEAGILKGKGNNRAVPGSSVTREEAAVMIVRALEHAGFDLEAIEGDKSFEAFKDAGKASAWAVEALEVVVKAEIFNGKTATSFEPKANITRAEIAVALDRFLTSVAGDVTPEDSTPEETTPEGTTPEGTTPEGTTPAATTPEATTPAGTTPTGTTPADTTL